MRIKFRKVLSIVTIVSLVSVSTLTQLLVSKAYAGLASSASVQMGDSRPSQSGVTYTTLFTPSGVTGIQCMNVVFAVNPDMTGGVPAALVTTSGAKGTITGGGLTDANWSLYNTGNNGTLQYESASARATTATAITIPTTNITNTSATLFYAQITTYTTLTGHDCSGTVDQSNVIALVTVGGITTTVTVAPTIAFSVADYGTAVNSSGDTAPNMVAATSSAIFFGTVAAGATKWGSQTLTVSTNGAHGYTLYTRYSGAMTDAASDTIRDQAGTPSSGNDFDASASQSSFAYTTDAASPYDFGGTANKWAGLTTSNVAINAKSNAVNSDLTHIEYKIGVSNVQPPGTYSTVIAYTATPSY
jgi:hypothetical protein